MKSLWAFFFLLLTPTLRAQSFQTYEKCILSFERSTHPGVVELKKKLQSQNEILFSEFTTPAEIPEYAKICKTMTLVIHSALRSKDLADLLYFYPMQEPSRTQALLQHLNHLEQKIREQEKIVRHLQMNSFTKNQFLVQKQKLNSLLKEREKLQNQPKDEPIYGPPKRVFNLVFENVLVAKKEGSATLEKLRILVCSKEQVLNQYSSLQQLSQYGIDLEFSKTTALESFQSAVYGHEVQSFDLKWILN